MWLGFSNSWWFVFTIIATVFFYSFTSACTRISIHLWMIWEFNASSWTHNFRCVLWTKTCLFAKSRSKRIGIVKRNKWLWIWFRLWRKSLNSTMTCLRNFFVFFFWKFGWKWNFVFFPSSWNVPKSKLVSGNFLLFSFLFQIVTKHPERNDGTIIFRISLLYFGHCFWIARNRSGNSKPSVWWNCCGEPERFGTSFGIFVHSLFLFRKVYQSIQWCRCYHLLGRFMVQSTDSTSKIIDFAYLPSSKALSTQWIWHFWLFIAIICQGDYQIKLLMTFRNTFFVKPSILKLKIINVCNSIKYFQILRSSFQYFLVMRHLRA